MHHTTLIGLEVHVQLLTKSKLFCGCLNKFNPENPNVQTCPVCLGLPGSLPVMNRKAFHLALKTAIALNCEMSPFTKWDRKQYYYPDLPKAYQISQYDLPFSHDGWLEFEIDSESGATKKVGIIRAHLEEDAGKNLHDESGKGGDSRVDLNRCGTPLLEIVSEPDMRTPQEAKTFLEELKLLLTYLGVSDCNMQEGSLRCDANVNLHVHTDDGQKIATPIVEIKNLNSFRGVEMAIDYEARQQFDEWKQTGKKLGDVPKQTRGWDATRNVTFAQRGKEEASDYRYLPDPDLVPVTVAAELIEDICNSTGEFPADRRKRFRAHYQLSNYDVAVIIDQGEKFADYFEEVAQACEDGKQAANWVTQDVLREMKERKLGIQEFPVCSGVLAVLLERVGAQEITTKSAREVFEVLLAKAETGHKLDGDFINQIIEERGLGIVSDSGELEGVITAIVDKNPKAVKDFRGGKQAAIGALIGQVMREVKGADPKLVRKMLVDKMNFT